VTAYSLRMTFSQLAMAIEPTSAGPDGCGRRASGHAAAATPSGVMNSRRFIQGDTANVGIRMAHTQGGSLCGCETGNPFCRVARLMTVARSPAHRNQQAAPRATGLIQAEAAGAAPPAAPRTKAEKEKPQPGCHRLSMDGQARPQRCPIPRGICDISWPARGSW
jgi:hypothetical protein